MFRVGGIALFPELALIVTPDKELARPVERVDTVGETARFAAQTCQIVAQIGVPAFNRVGLAFVHHCGIGRVAIDQVAIGCKPIALVGPRLRGLVDHRLQGCYVPLQHDRPADERVRGPVQRRYDVDSLFWVPTKV